MGTWGPGILQDDVAVDTQLMFEDALAGGMSVELASRHVIIEEPEYFTDEDDGPVATLALAALQLQHRSLDPQVRDLALATIATGAAMERWETASPDVRAARARIIEQFETALRCGECDSADLQHMLDPIEWDTLVKYRHQPQ